MALNIEAKIKEAFNQELEGLSVKIGTIFSVLIVLVIIPLLYQDVYIIHLLMAAASRLCIIIPSILFIILVMVFKRKSLAPGLFILIKMGLIIMGEGIVIFSGMKVEAVQALIVTMIGATLGNVYGLKEIIITIALPLAGMIIYYILQGHLAPGQWASLITNPLCALLLMAVFVEIQYQLRYREVRSRFLLEAANKELKKLDKTKDEFLSIVSHDLKSPLATILSSSDLLMDGLAGEITTKQREIIDIIKRQGHALKKLIETLLDYTRMEFGKLALNRERFSINIELDEIIKEIKPQLETKKILLKMKLPHENVFINGDKNMFQRIIHNLLGNAIKYSKEGGEIDVEVKREAENLFITVKDNGLGIEKGNLPHLFDRFYLVDTTQAREAMSLGLGLYICKNFVEAHGGKIWAESEGLGKGTKLTVSLPIS
ncbi:MAG: HAMP domain-containing sensor histidine kinase [bacterium]